jgi:elongation factor G
MRAVPVLCGAALRNQGIQPLMDAIVDYLPSPLDIPPIEGTNPVTGEREVRLVQDEESFAALAFKVMMDEGRKLIYIRIYSGVLKVGTEVYNPRLKRGEKISRIFQMHAHQRARDRSGDGIKGNDHRRHSVRPESPGSPRAHRFL